MWGWHWSACAFLKCRNTNKFNPLIQSKSIDIISLPIETWLVWQTLGGLMFEKASRPLDPSSLCATWNERDGLGMATKSEVDQKTESLINFSGDQNEKPSKQVQLRFYVSAEREVVHLQVSDLQMQWRNWLQNTTCHKEANLMNFRALPPATTSFHALSLGANNLRH